MASFSLSTYSYLVVMLMFLLGRSVSADVYYPSSGDKSGRLSDESYYFQHFCPSALTTIKTLVQNEIRVDRRMGASLLRLHFHDCFVNGCDGSVLLDNTTATNGEKSAAPNLNSLRGFEVIDRIKSALEFICPKTVSCADILAVSARDSVDILRYGLDIAMFKPPTWKVELGRKDALTASMDAANRNLPPPFFNLTALISFFKNKGFSERELVVLSGGHTIGKAQCANFRDHIYKDSNIDQKFAAELKKTCPITRGNGDGKLADLDSSAYKFDNAYFQDLVARRGLLHSDQELYNGGITDSIVKEFSKDQYKFFFEFGEAMKKMGRLSPPAGSQPGEIRVNCRKRN